MFLGALSNSFSENPPLNTPATLRKKENLAQVFSCEFCEISKNTFFTEHLLVTAFDIVRGVFRTLVNTYDTIHCVKSFHIRSFSGQYFPAFGLTAKIYEVSLRIQTKYEKIQT